jgi:hypothetical protein
LALVTTLPDHRTGDGLGEVVYANFSGGLNDTSSPAALADSEVAIAENVDFATEVKAFSSRKGTQKVNAMSFGKDVTDGFAWTVGPMYKKCVVMGKALYDLDGGTGAAKKKIKIQGDEIYPWVMYNRLYFGDGAELYVWGDFDYTTEIEETVSTGYDSETGLGTIVRYNGDDAGKGVKGHFYMALTARPGVDIASENYLDETNWRDETDIPGMISSVVRPLPEVSGERKETFRFEVLSGATADGQIAFCLDNLFYSATLSSTAHATVQAAAAAIKTQLLAYADFGTGASAKWELSGPEGNALTITAKSGGPIPDAFVDLGRNDYLLSLIEIAWRTTVQGAADANDFAPIRKCTMFWMHSGSMRVFAGGSPDDNALWYSEIGEPGMWNSSINKVYPGNGFGKMTGLAELSGNLLVSYQNGWYAWSGIDVIEDAKWEMLNIPYGCACNRSIALTPYSFTFLARDGVYSVQASILNLAYVLVTGRSLIKKISEDKVENIVASIGNRQKCRGVFWENAYCLAYNYAEESPPSPRASYTGFKEVCSGGCFADGIPANTKVLKYEWDTQSWTTYTGWTVNQWMTDATGLFFCTDNFVLKAGEGYSDTNTGNGEKKAIDVRVRTKDYVIYSPFKYKEVRFVGLMLKQFSGYGDSKLDVLMRAGHRQFKILGIDSNESLAWGRSWFKRWGWRDEQIKIAEASEVADTFSLEFAHSQTDDPFTVIAIGFAYRTLRQMLPQDEELLKDRVLNQDTVSWR